MMSGNLECSEIIQLCTLCQKEKKERGKPCSFRETSKTYCRSCIIADNQLAFFKKMVIDENTREMHEEVKEQFADRVDNEEEWLANHGF